MKKFHILSVIVGLVLLTILVIKIGAEELWKELGQLGWGLIPFILLEGVADVFHTIGWRNCLVSSRRELSYLQLFRIRMAGYSINYLTPTASLGGEITKGALLSLHQSGAEAATGVIVGKLAYATAQLFFVVAGSLVILWGIPLPLHIWLVMLFGTLIVGTGIFSFLVIQKYGKLGAVFRWLSKHKIGGRRLQKLSEPLTRIDEELKLFYKNHPLKLPRAMFWHLLGMSLGIIQSWYFLYLMTDKTSLLMAAGIWCLGGWLDLISFPLVTNVGILEVTRVVVFTALGFHSALGLTFGIALRIEQLFWAAVGLLMYVSLLASKEGGSLELSGDY